jgi:Lon protease-like protein
MAVQIPVFPLGVVLFPHMPLPLHIFEERYRQMMRDCRESGTGFGIVAIREGVEAGGPASPHSVGTLAQLRKVEELGDGRFNILVVGKTRYRIGSLSRRKPYLTAEVEYLQDSAGDETSTGPLAGRVSDAFRRYADTLRTLAGEAASELELPDDPELLSYLVAATLQVETRHKQALLETDSAGDRLRGCLTLLRRELTLLDQRLARPAGAIAPVSSN